MTKQKKPSKMLYKLRVLLSPSLWQRIYAINVGYDDWLWNQLENPSNVIKPIIHIPNRTCEYEVEFIGQKIWISNSPYSDGKLRGEPSLCCSRATALLFREKVKEMKNKQAEDRLTKLLNETKGKTQ